MTPHERLAALNSMCLEYFGRYYVELDRAEAAPPDVADRWADLAAEELADVMGLEAEQRRPNGSG